MSPSETDNTDSINTASGSAETVAAKATLEPVAMVTPAAASVAALASSPQPLRGWLGVLLSPRPIVGWAMLMGVALLVIALRLGHDGLWDPHEVRLLEPLSDASNPLDAHPLSQPVSGFRSRILLWPLWLGVRWLGVNELGARMPMAAMALLSLTVIFALGSWLRSRSTGMLAGLVLLSTPLFFMSARLASLSLMPILAQSLSVLGLALFSWPRGGAAAPSTSLSMVMGAALAAVGLTLGGLSSGMLVGVAVPAAAVALAMSLAGSPTEGTDGRRQMICLGLLGLLLGAALLPVVRLVAEHAAQTAKAAGATAAQGASSLRMQVAAAALLSAAAVLWLLGRRGVAWVLAALVVAVGVLPAGPAEKVTGYSPWLAGVLHWPGNREVQIDTLVRSLGFALFPWSGVVAAAIAGLFSWVGSQLASADGGEATAGTGDSAATSSAEGAWQLFSSLLPLCWFCVGYVFVTLYSAQVGDVAFAPLAAPVLLVAIYLDRALSDDASGGTLAGLCVGLGVVVVGRDFFLSPELYVSTHVGETLRWPAPLGSVGKALMLGSLGLGALWGVALALRGRLRRLLLPLGLVGALGLALGAVHGLMPALARHVSYRGLYTRYQKLGGGTLGLYSVQQASGKIYGQNGVQLFSLPELMQFLAGGSASPPAAGQPPVTGPTGRTFAIVGAGELGAIDREAHLRGMPYYVVDDSNAQFILLSNRLLPGEEDLNPLRRLVSTQPPQPRVPLHVTFEDRVELVGYDAPTDVSRGEELVIRLYYRVLQPLGINYKIFLHFDGNGSRWNGDHAPVGGKFQTMFWSPGTYITDEHRIPVGRMTQSPGYYQIFTGLWSGGDGPRMSVTQGAHEPDHRVRIGTIRVK